MSGLPFKNVLYCFGLHGCEIWIANKSFTEATPFERYVNSKSLEFPKTIFPIGRKEYLIHCGASKMGPLMPAKGIIEKEYKNHNGFNKTQFDSIEELSQFVDFMKSEYKQKNISEESMCK